MAMLRFVNEPVVFSFPNGAPVLVSPGEMSVFPLAIETVFGGVLNTDTATLHVRYGNDGVFAQRSIVHVSGSEYEVQLPVSMCGLQSEYWITIETTDFLLEMNCFTQGLPMNFLVGI